MTTVTTSNPGPRIARPTPATAGAVSPVALPAVTPSRSMEPVQRQAMISEAAYFLSERRGFLPGYELDDWLGAEREIDRLLAASVPSTPTGG